MSTKAPEKDAASTPLRFYSPTALELAKKAQRRKNGKRRTRLLAEALNVEATYRATKVVPKKAGTDFTPPPTSDGNGPTTVTEEDNQQPSKDDKHHEEANHNGDDEVGNELSGEEARNEEIRSGFDGVEGR